MLGRFGRFAVLPPFVTPLPNREHDTRPTYFFLVLTATHARTVVGARWPLGWDLGGSGQLDLLTSMIFVKRIGCTWSSVEGLELPNDRFETPTYLSIEFSYKY